MRFQTRDGELLQLIYDYGGVVAGRHIMAIFWPGKTLRAMQRRLAKLYKLDYIARPTREQWKTRPIPEAIYWLGWRGAGWIAEQSDVVVKASTAESMNENQQRGLQVYLIKKGIYWYREPRWNQLTHDLQAIDFRLAVERAVAAFPTLTLEEWQHEGIFRTDTDVIEIRTKNRQGLIKERKKGVCPDGYFVIVDEQRLLRGQPARARHLMEIDSATHSNPKFGRDKVAPGIAYIHSQAYKERFGANAGRWLIQTSGQRRMRNLMQQTQRTAGDSSGFFYFTTEHLFFNSENVLTDPIWWQVGKQEPTSLFVLD
jgi:hypothetical protein